MKKILLVEDEKDLRNMIKKYLIKQDFLVLEADNGEKALELFYKENFDLVLLDVMLPKRDGWSICREIKKYTNIPVIIMTSHSEEDDEVFGFEVGADDFVRKPFSLKVLVARMNKLLKPSAQSTKIKVGELTIDEVAHTVEISGSMVNLTPKEYEFLNFLTKNKEKVISRERMLNEVWGFDFFGDTRTIDTHIKSLRKKINKDCIETVRGIGYRFKVKF
ncbi:MAG: response regulator transcription factor [Cetobacterium sp.]|uniref:response regulator transcription factor n=3 Tax=Cetobacterium TaxID=180162 RepID=UPI00163BF1C2|nr:response regulator transcription factor [Cetobacterium sp. 2A]MBC2856750.1 response regulator transcription factor [Cetobacterium sp. 2A]